MSHAIHQAEPLATSLRAAREAKGLSQRDLSALAGVPQPQISRIEAGVVDLRISSLVALANALGLNVTLVPHKALPAVRSIMRQTSHHTIDTEPKPAYSLDDD
ncbi:anaerobic benzoate catabolism transcriptional regulator [Thiorhodovibrio winogradskyi]|uniref:Anaerobic benzoate catabolism transcriptional regulator n=1 Tax=Thiorhodovibrio winogradskyi TaxID=77007 RepID=A0ABZ0S553_9GAMM|nr:helix-turn-helix transcriptional regulator [Thiorhodovibrio winogradskyi]